jgi:hypothetical protein
VSTPQTVTVRTVDHGPVTFTCPTWCANSHQAQNGGYRADISHDSEKTPLLFNGTRLGHTEISQAPYAERSTREVQGFVAVTYGEDTGRDPAGLYDLAAAMDTHADKVRDLADQLTQILGGAR